MWEQVISHSHSYSRCMNVEVLMRTKPLMCALNYVIHRGAALRSMTAEKSSNFDISHRIIHNNIQHTSWLKLLPTAEHLPQIWCTFFGLSFSLRLLWKSKLKIQSLRILYALCLFHIRCGLIKSQRRSIFLRIHNVSYEIRCKYRYFTFSSDLFC